MALKLSDYIATQLPEFVREQYPLFLSFVKSYYEQQELKGNPLDIVDNFTSYFDVNYKNYGIKRKVTLLRDITKFDENIRCANGELLPSKNGYVRINEEIIFYQGIIETDGVYTLTDCKRGQTYKTKLDGQFVDTIPSSHKAESVVYDISSLFLDYILERFQEQILHNFPYQHIKDRIDRRQVLKHIKDFNIAKGTESSLKFLFSILLDSTEEVRKLYPSEFLYRISDSSYKDSYGIYAFLLAGSDPSKLSSSLLTQADVTIPVEDIVNLGDGYFKVLINENEYSGELDFETLINYEGGSLQPIFVISDVIPKNLAPYSRVGDLLESRPNISSLPFSFDYNPLYEDEHNYFLNIEEQVYIFRKYSGFVDLGPIKTDDVGVYLDNTLIKSYFNREVFYGNIVSIDLLDKGFGYKEPPTVIIDYEPGVARSVLVGDVIDRIELIDESRIYQTKPHIEITTGRGADVSPTVTDGRITSLKILEEGQYYSEPPRIFIQDLNGRGVGALFNAVISEGKLVGTTKVSEGSFYSDTTQAFVIPASNKSQAAAEVILEVFDELKVVNTPVDLLHRLDSNFRDSTLELTQTRTHSPIIGFAYDGSPIYGPYAHDNPFDPTSPIRLMRSGWSLKEFLPSTRPLGLPGTYFSDYQYTYSWYNLDRYNGRYCITPEYPKGVYAYFLTTEYNPSDNDQLYHRVVFPYVVGEKFHSRPAKQVSNLEFSLLNNISKVENSFELTTFKAKVTEVSSGTLSEVVSTSANNTQFKIQDRIHFEHQDQLVAIVSGLKLSDVEDIKFDSGNFIRLEQPIYGNRGSIYYSSESRFKLLVDVRNESIFPVESSSQFTTGVYSRSDDRTSETVYVRLEVTRKANYQVNSILYFFVDGVQQERTYTVVEETSNSDFVVVKFSLEGDEASSYLSNNGFINNFFEPETVVFSSEVRDTQGVKIIRHRNVSYSATVGSILSQFGLVRFNSTHGIIPGQRVELGGDVTGTRTTNVISTIQGIILDSFDTVSRDVCFYRGFEYRLTVTPDQYIDFNYFDDINRLIELPEVNRIDATTIVIKFTEKTRYDYLWIFDRNLPRSFGKKILVKDSPISGTLDIDRVTDTEIIFNITKTTTDFKFDSIDFNSSFLKILEPYPGQQGQIDSVSIINGNSNLEEVPYILGVENQTTTYNLNINHDVLYSIDNISHNISIIKPRVLCHINGQYIDYRNFTIYSKHGKVTHVVLKDPVKVNGSISFKILESEVDLYAYSNDIGLVNEVEVVIPEYSLPPSIPPITTSRVYVIDSGGMILDEEISHQGLILGRITSIQGNNIITIPNSNFNVGDLIVGETSGIAATIIHKTNGDFKPIVTDGIDLVDFRSTDNKGHIGEASQRLQDGRINQDHSYVVRSDHSIEEWRPYVVDTIHPVGYELYGELYEKYPTVLEIDPEPEYITFNYRYSIDVDITSDLRFYNHIHYDFALNVVRGQGSIVTTGDLYDLAISRVFLEEGNQVISNSGPYSVILYTVDGVINDVVRYYNGNLPQTIPLSNWRPENKFYGIGFLNDDNENYYQNLKNIFQRDDRWLDAANLVELNKDNLLRAIEIDPRDLPIYKLFIDAVVFSIRFGGNNKVKDLLTKHPDLNFTQLISEIIKVIPNPSGQLSIIGISSTCADVVSEINSLLTSEIQYPDYINNETKEFELFWEDGTPTNLTPNENLFIIIDGILQVPGESYEIKNNKIIFSEPLKWQQTNADKLGTIGMNINTFVGFNLSPYDVLDIEEHSDTEFLLVDRTTNIRKQINYPLALLVFIDGVLQEYGSVYTLNESLITFTDKSILNNRTLHIRYLYKYDINMTHTIHDYWIDAYYANAVVFIDYTTNPKPMFDFLKANQYREVELEGMQTTMVARNKTIVLGQTSGADIGEIRHASLLDNLTNSRSNTVRFEIITNRNLDNLDGPFTLYARDTIDSKTKEAYLDD